MTLEGLPLTTLPSIILTTGPLTFVWTYFKQYVEKNGALRWAETLRDTHNFVVASLSLVLAAYVLDIGHDILTVRTGYQVDPNTLAYLYHLLKIYEYLDIPLSILSGQIKVSKYAAFTHLALPYWSYYRVVQNNAFDWRFQVITDCFVRFLSRLIPWLIEDLNTEEIILNMAEEWRWYPDLVITAFFVAFVLQGNRESPDAVRLFGPPEKDENTARMVSVAVLLYASFAKRQGEPKEDKSKKSQESLTKPKDTPITNSTANATTTSANPDVANALRGSRRQGGRR